MTRDEVLARLRELADTCDEESAHGEADNLLLNLIGDAEIATAWNAIPKWFA